MLKYALKRIIKALITIFFILTLVFFFTRMSGDPTNWILPDDATEEQRIEMRHSLGLDRPLHEQYFEVMTSLFTGNAGRSYNYLRPVSELYAERMGATIRLGLISFSLAALVGVTLGTIAAVKRNSFFDRFTIMISIAGSTLPNFVLGILLVFLFCFVLRLLPSGGASSASSYIMPVIAMAVGPMANIARLTRTSLLDVLRGAAHAAHGEEDVVDEEVAREALDLVGERRGEHERLPVARHARLLHDVADLRLEAHVQHAVRFVQHQMAKIKKRKRGNVMPSRPRMPRWMRSLTRPGVPTRMSQPERSESRTSRIGVPP